MNTTNELQTESGTPDRDRWWRHARTFSVGELVADGVVHGIGLAIAVGLGTALLIFAAKWTAPDELPALILYLATLLTVLGVSLTFNLAPVSRFKKFMARLDQAAIFLFIAGTYTPFLALLGHNPSTGVLGVAIWAAALIGVTLKLIVPERFGRLALVLYLGIGWSGILVFHNLASVLPPVALWLVVAGGVTYSAGILFHLWERLKFHNALWHVFVVAGASLHLWAIFDTMVLSRLA
jgi:hemolysin III